MMYMHFCKHCNRIHILNGHKTNCPGCDAPLVELAISFHEFSDMNLKERTAYQDRCNDERQLETLRCPSRSGKYERSYKKVRIS